MRTGISIIVGPSDRLRLEGIVGHRCAAQKHVWRAAIILLSADGVGTQEIKRRTGKSKACVWRWQERFMEEGVGGLLRDKTRPPRILPLAPDASERVVALTLVDPPFEATHWTAIDDGGGDPSPRGRGLLVLIEWHRRGTRVLERQHLVRPDDGGVARSKASACCTHLHKLLLRCLRQLRK